MSRIKVSKQDIQNASVFRGLEAYRHKSLEKKSFIELAERNVNIANEKGIEFWRLQVRLNETVKSIIAEILIKKTRF